MAAEDAAVTVTLRANLKDYEAALKAAVRATERAAKAAETAVSGIGKGATFQAVNQNFAKSSNQLANDARVLQFQLNDVFSGLASGQGIRALQMQLGQIAQQMSGGSLAQGARTLGTAFVGMINPINAAVVVFGLAATAATNYFFGAEEGAEKATKEAEKHLATLRKVADTYGHLGPALDNYVTKQEKAIDAAKALEAILAQQVIEQQKVDQAWSDIDAGDAVASLFVRIQQNAGAAAETLQNELLAAVTAFQQAQSTGIGVVEKWNDLVATATRLEKQYGAGTKETADALSSLGAAIGKTTQALETLKEAADAIPRVQIDIEDLTTALKGLVSVDGSGLLAIIDMLRRQFPDAVSAAGSSLRNFGDFVSTTWDEVGTSIKSAADLIKKEEGFIPDARWDVNHYRTGYGSDTFVDEMGKVREVTKDTVVTVAQAEADLKRRIGEFQATILSQIGPDFWRSLDEGQQAALTSIAYNYGSLPPKIVKAIKEGDRGQVAAAIDSLSANPDRRHREASLYARGGGEAAQGPLKQLETQREAVKSLAEWNVETERRIELEKQIADINGQVWETEAQRAAQVEALRIAEEQLTVLRKAGVPITAEMEQQIRSMAQAQSEATLKSQEQAVALKQTVEDQKKTAETIKQMNQQFASIIGGGLSSFVQDLIAGKDAGEAFNNMLQRMIGQLVDMAVQMFIIKPLMASLGGGFGAGGFEAGGTVGLSHHTMGRNVSPLMFAGAPRYASGGMVGLKPGEVPIIAHRGEVIIPNARRLAGNAAGGNTELNTTLGDVNIDMSQTGMVAADNDAAKQFGLQIQQLIQVEMIRESRPGGLLRRTRA